MYLTIINVHNNNYTLDKYKLFGLPLLKSNINIMSYDIS